MHHGCIYTLKSPNKNAWHKRRLTFSLILWKEWQTTVKFCDVLNLLVQIKSKFSCNLWNKNKPCYFIVKPAWWLNRLLCITSTSSHFCIGFIPFCKPLLKIIMIGIHACTTLFHLQSTVYILTCSHRAAGYFLNK